MNKPSEALRNFKASNIHVVGVPKGGKYRKNFWRDMNENFWNVMKAIKSREPISPMNSKYKKDEGNCTKVRYNDNS